MARSVVRFDPFSGLEVLRRELLEDGLLRGARGRLPTTDIYTEGDDALVVEAHLPHFKEDDISVTVDRRTLVIQAERREKDEDKRKQYVVRESSTSFYRSVALPDQADESGISANFRRGVLKVTVPLRGESSARSISIESSGEESSAPRHAAEDPAAGSGGTSPSTS